MIYLAFCKDSVDGARLREKHRDAHRRHFRAVALSVMLGGPCAMIGDNGRKASVLLIKAKDAQAAMALVASDPYCQHGVWESIDLCEFLSLAGQWVPEDLHAG